MPRIIINYTVVIPLVTHIGRSFVSHEKAPPTILFPPSQIKLWHYIPTENVPLPHAHVHECSVTPHILLHHAVVLAMAPSIARPQVHHHAPLHHLPAVRTALFRLPSTQIPSAPVIQSLCVTPRPIAVYTPPILKQPLRAPLSHASLPTIRRLVSCSEVAIKTVPAMLPKDTVQHKECVRVACEHEKRIGMSAIVSRGDIPKQTTDPARPIYHEKSLHTSNIKNESLPAATPAPVLTPPTPYPCFALPPLPAAEYKEKVKVKKREKQKKKKGAWRKIIKRLFRGDQSTRKV